MTAGIGDREHPPRLVRWSLVLGLVLLSPICAEYLIGYDSGIADPVGLLTGLAILAPLYGTVAVLIREFTRRAGRGWPTILLLGTAFGLVQAGLIDQSLFDPAVGVDPAEATKRVGTPIPGIGVDATNLLNYVSGHAVWSFAAPIAVMESLAPRAARQPWLTWPGITAMVVLYLIGAAIIFSEEMVTAAPAQLIGTSVIVVVLAVVAFALPRSSGVPTSGWVPPVWLVGCMAFVLLVLTQLFQEDWGWGGVALAVLAFAVLGSLTLLWSGHSSWGPQHVLALAGAAVLVRATLAFAVHPIGEISYPIKYAVNAVILAGACGLLVLAAYRLRRADPGERALTKDFSDISSTRRD